MPPLFRGSRANQRRLAAVRDRLRAGEKLHIALPGEDLSLGGAPCRIFLTNQRLLWALDAKPDIIMDVPYDHFIGIGINFETRDLAFEARRQLVEVRGVTVPPASPETLLGALRFLAGPTSEEIRLTDEALDFVSYTAGRHCSKHGEAVVQEVIQHYRRAGDGPS